ncbi:MAG: hypothetical protein AAF657_16555 [Acidobacteriota bacterium]
MILTRNSSPMCFDSTRSWRLRSKMAGEVALLSTGFATAVGASKHRLTKPIILIVVRWLDAMVFLLLLAPACRRQAI